MLKVDDIKDIHQAASMLASLGAGATAAFIQKCQQRHAITGKDLLLKYDKTMKTVEKYQLR